MSNGGSLSSADSQSSSMGGSSPSADFVSQMTPYASLSPASPETIHLNRLSKPFAATCSWIPTIALSASVSSRIARLPYRPVCTSWMKSTLGCEAASSAASSCTRCLCTALPSLKVNLNKFQDCKRISAHAKPELGASGKSSLRGLPASLGEPEPSGRGCRSVSAADAALRCAASSPTRAAAAGVTAARCSAVSTLSAAGSARASGSTSASAAAFASASAFSAEFSAAFFTFFAAA
mmetsp:Transcript_43397/g.107250  ORF Transcript_43397/g.107250 Transcript_43397/m.107250 type:complete len:236 (+) Transcript_43397:1214-1921(+)